MAKPVIVFSSCENAQQTGDGIYNGGTKLQTIWCKLLRQHGHDAYLCTYTGEHEEWMIEHAPYISIRQANKIARQGRPLRVMTTWIVSEMALSITAHPYFYDAEIAHTSCAHHFVALQRWLPELKKVGTHSRTQQAWYMATFGFTPVYIQEWSDPDYFTPAPEQRRAGQVGWMWEGPHSPEHIELIRQYCQQAHVDVTFVQVGGSEQQVITTMQQCDVFLGLNSGKHPLWGEGCPRSPQEAMHCGAVVIAYDVFGNREYLFQDYTGFLVQRNNPQALAEMLVRVMNDDALRETVRRQGTDYVKHVFAPTELKYQQIKEFLNL